MYVQPAWHNCCLRVAILATWIKKTKTAKDILDDNFVLLAQLPLCYDFYKWNRENLYVESPWPAVSIAAPTLQFLQSKKRKLNWRYID